MPTLTTYLPDADPVIKPQSNVRSDASGTAPKLRTVGTIAETHRAFGTVKGTVDPANGSDVWYVWYASGRYEFTAKDNVTAIARPTGVLDDGFTKATQEAAVAAATAPLINQIKVLNLEVTGLAPRAAIGDAITALVKAIAG